jgi:uncharacterized membrane protein YedE/YeeE
LAHRIKDTVEVELNPKEADRQKLRWLIIAFVGYFLFVLYALPRAAVLPYQVFALLGVLNFAAMLAFVFSIRKGLPENERTNAPGRRGGR